MDILSFVLGYNKGKAQSGESADAVLDEVDAYLDAINGGSVHSITFIGGNGKTLCVVTVPQGTDCENPIDTGLISTPTKKSTDTYDYQYTGWSLLPDGDANDDALKNITESKTVYAAFKSIPIRGTLGNGRWEISKPYTTLHFYGNGEITCGDAQYFKHTSTVTTVEFHDENGVITGLGNNLFYAAVFAFTKMTTVSIPQTVTSIGNATFAFAQALPTITIPASVTQIGASAFQGCRELTSVIFENKSGWKVYDYETGELVNTISSSTLSEAHAAELLTGLYKGCVWKRS